MLRWNRCLTEHMYELRCGRKEYQVALLLLILHTQSWLGSQLSSRDNIMILLRYPHEQQVSGTLACESTVCGITPSGDTGTGHVHGLGPLALHADLESRADSVGNRGLQAKPLLGSLANTCQKITASNDLAPPALGSPRSSPSQGSRPYTTVPHARSQLISHPLLEVWRDVDVAPEDPRGGIHEVLPALGGGAVGTEDGVGVRVCWNRLRGRSPWRR